MFNVFVIEESLKILSENFLPRSLSIKSGFRFELIKLSSKVFVIDWAFSFLRGTVHPKFEKLSITTRTYQ